MPFVEQGKVKALGVSTRQRFPMLPQVPTIAENAVPAGRLRLSSMYSGGNAPCNATMRKASLSRSMSVPNLASQMRVAFSRIAWNTESSSPGDELMTLQHLGGCRLLLQRLAQLACSRLHLIEQPHILDRDHRLVGEGRH
jgi:hypothetical protein